MFEVKVVLLLSVPVGAASARTTALTAACAIFFLHFKALQVIYYVDASDSATESFLQGVTS